MIKRFQWTNKSGIYNIVDLSNLVGEGINRSNSLNIYGFWYKRYHGQQWRGPVDLETTTSFKYHNREDIWTIWINEKEVKKHMIDISNKCNPIVLKILLEYLKLKRDHSIENLLK